MIRLAAATYPLDWFADWSGYEAKLTDWVAQAAGHGAQILLFPEYGAMELASIADVDAADLSVATRAVSEALPRATEILSGLARAHGVHILAPSGPVFEGGRLVNRAALLTPTGGVAHQDKQIMTPWEVDPWGVAGNGPLTVFETALGRIAVLICYDCEFPLLARQLTEAGADLLLIPSATETVAGYSRVRIGAMARALEGQCFTAMASLTGRYPLEAVDVNHGAAGIFCPPDTGLPEDGIIASATLDEPGWCYGDLDLSLLDTARRGGGVRTRADWPLSADRAVTRMRLA
jgi:predicted amidohydrolase